MAITKNIISELTIKRLIKENPELSGELILDILVAKQEIMDNTLEVYEFGENLDKNK
jgi:hypothetical protein